MISSSQVNGDKDSLSSAKDNFTTAIDGLNGSWQGMSYDSLIAKAQNFSNEFFPTLDNQLTSFANACDLYEKYVTCKNNIKKNRDSLAEYERKQSNLPENSTISYATTISSLRQKIREYETEKGDLKDQIEAALSQASGNSLTATAVAQTDYSSESADTTTQTTDTTSNSSISLATNTTETDDNQTGTDDNQTGTDDTKTSTNNIQTDTNDTQNDSVQQKAITWATSIANDDTHGYSGTNNTGNPDYDCSSLIFEAYEKAGIPIKESGANSTKNMKSTLTNIGFEFVSGTPDTNNLQPGDILWKNGHTEMYIGNGKLVGAHKDRDGISGDSSGKEINVYDYTNKSWSGYFRYTGNNDL